MEGCGIYKLGKGLAYHMFDSRDEETRKKWAINKEGLNKLLNGEQIVF